MSLTLPVSGATITAALHSSNYTAIQNAINNDVISKPASLASGETVVYDGANMVRSSVTRVGTTSLGSGTPAATNFLRGDGAWIKPPSYEYDRSTQATDVSVTATTTGTANTICTGSAVTYDGAEVVEIVFSAYAMSKGTTRINICLYEDGSYVKDLADSQSTGTFGYGRLRRTPSAGSHTYSLRAYVDAGTGTVFATSNAPVELTIRKV